MVLISVLLEENTRRALRRAIADRSLQGAIVPLAATEQHNEHLAMGHDAKSVHWVAVESARRLFPSVAVTPVLNIGVSEHWMDHPGTLTLPADLFTEVVYSVCDSLRRAGLRRILLLNGHGGNRRPVEARLDEFRERLGIHLDFYSYWQAFTPEFVARHLESGECPGHAAEFETSVAMALFPETVHVDHQPYPESELRITDARRAEDDQRFFAQSALATPEKGRVMMDEAVRWVTQRLKVLLAGGSSDDRPGTSLTL